MRIDHTHLFPGAQLRCLDTPGDQRLSANDGVLMLFSDGIFVSGRLLKAEAHAAVLYMPAYRTQRGTKVAARAWRIVPGGELGLVRVLQRLPI